jgi:hypothetical protein
VGSFDEWERLGRRKRIVDEWEQKSLAGLERECADVRAALQAAGVSGIEDLKDALGRVADADAVVAEWRRRLAEWEAGPEAKAARAERTRLDAEARDLEARMANEAPGFVRESSSIEHEIRRLEAEAAAPSPAAPAPAAAAPRPAGDPLRAALAAAAEELGQSPAGAGRAVQAKASQALSGLSFQRLAGVSVDDRGNVQVTTAGRAAQAARVPPADQDLVWLALKLAFLELGLSGGGKVAVVDDAFAGVSDGARRFAARLLKQMARAGQIVHTTGDPAFREAADHSA